MDTLCLFSSIHSNLPRYIKADIAAPVLEPVVSNLRRSTLAVTDGVDGRHEQQQESPASLRSQVTDDAMTYKSTHSGESLSRGNLGQLRECLALRLSQSDVPDRQVQAVRHVRDRSGLERHSLRGAIRQRPRRGRVGDRCERLDAKGSAQQLGEDNGRGEGPGQEDSGPVLPQLYRICGALFRGVLQ